MNVARCFCADRAARQYCGIRKALRVHYVSLVDKIASDWPADRVAELLPRARLAAGQAEQQPQAMLSSFVVNTRCTSPVL